MVKMQTIGIALVVVVFLSILLFYLRRRWNKMRQDNDDTTAERQEEADRAQDTSVPVRTRVSHMPLPAKAMLFSFVVILGIIVWQVYSYMKTGSGTQILYAHSTQLFIVGMVGAVTMGFYERRRSSSEGKLINIYEPDHLNGETEPTVEQIPIQKDDVTGGEGSLLATEYTNSRLFFLWRRPKRIAEDEKLRNEPGVYRPIEDQIQHQIPDHAVEVADGIWINRTSGRETVKSPISEADYEYQSPKVLSMEQYLRIRSDNEQIKMTYREVMAKNARQSEIIEALEHEIDNLNEQDWTRFIEYLRELAPHISGGNRQYTVQQHEDEYQGGHDGNGDGSSTRRQLIDLLEDGDLRNGGS